MKPKRVVLTGATGFIGSYLAEELIAKGYEVVALRRKNSDLWRVVSTAEQLQWIDTENPGWEQQLADYQAECLVHSAWLGVGFGQRDDWQSQLSNLIFTQQLIQIMAGGPLKKVIVLGSQAEYGSFEGRIDENYPANPTMAYGAVKLATLAVVRAFCQAKEIDWYWLRVFAVFGPREDPNWFVSFVASSFLKHESPALTKCEQRYDYLFASDLARAIIQTLPATQGLSGVYNISANRSTTLKQIVETLQKLAGVSTTADFGAIPYRPGQVMHMEGDSRKFESVFGSIEQTPLPLALAACLTFVKQAG
ncbi:NAD-dependent epimerase/dehydratase family protein [Hymenobacter terrenus]|uniref:NAD-dependent epimerase/dehydratase family protein n=1 Tax=Hymenobacter terrenus TaxID=1629124 RepID=UPI00061931F0|nr:NAD(P)-dependent oxidoreductase [Hymenobacter terrenus]